jgi:hypothetical protein
MNEAEVLRLRYRFFAAGSPADWSDRAQDDRRSNTGTELVIGGESAGVEPYETGEGRFEDDEGECRGGDIERLSAAGGLADLD